jgi:Flp pilus assembly pilin Flp
MRRLISRFVREDCGQDIIEYALLAALVGTVGIVLWVNIGAGINRAYLGWDTGVQNISACTPDPGGGGC